MYAFTYEVPATEEMYQQVRSGLGDLEPKGLIVHLVTKTDGGLRHTDVWESQEDWERYRDGAVTPSVQRVLKAAGIPPQGPPAIQDLELVDVLVGA